MRQSNQWSRKGRGPSRDQHWGQFPIIPIAYFVVMSFFLQTVEDVKVSRDSGLHCKNETPFGEPPQQTNSPKRNILLDSIQQLLDIGFKKFMKPEIIFQINKVISLL